MVMLPWHLAFFGVVWNEMNAVSQGSYQTAALSGIDLVPFLTLPFLHWLCGWCITVKNNFFFFKWNKFTYGSRVQCNILTITSHTHFAESSVLLRHSRKKSKECGCVIVQICVLRSTIFSSCHSNWTCQLTWGARREPLWIGLRLPNEVF